MRLLRFFIIGFILDVLATMDILFVANHLWLGVGFSSFLLTYIGYDTTFKLIESPERRIEIISFALGGSLGAMITLGIV